MSRTPHRPTPPADEPTSSRIAAVEQRRRRNAQTSHEMLNVVAGLRGYAEMLHAVRQEREAARARDDWMVDRIQALTARLARLGEDLLGEEPDPATVAQDDGVVAGAPTLRVEVVPLRVHEHLLECAHSFPGLQVEVECAEDLTVLADDLRLQQVLGNLVRNAERHGSPPVSVVALATPPDRVRITVSDAGPGIPRAYLPSLFDRSTRGPGVQRHGSGLGLSHSRALTEAQDGTLAYEPGDHAFVVTLPRPVDPDPPRAR